VNSLCVTKTMPIKKVIIHIGTYKTGSSSIQNTLARITGGEILYPLAGCQLNEPDVGVRHSLLAYWHNSPGRHGDWQSCVDNLLDELLRSNRNIAVLSCEGWCRQSTHQGLLALVERLRIAGLGDIEGVCYLRDVGDYARSVYREFCRRRGNRLIFQDFVVRNRGLWDYEGLIRRMKSVAPFSFFSYESQRDVVVHFLETIGAAPPLKSERSNSNPGMDCIGAEICRIANDISLPTGLISVAMTCIGAPFMAHEHIDVRAFGGGVAYAFAPPVAHRMAAPAAVSSLSQPIEAVSPQIRDWLSKSAFLSGVTLENYLRNSCRLRFEWIDTDSNTCAAV